MLVNSFILNTTDFLNKFASLCEQKLLNVSQQVQRVEIVLALLEAKLESITWMSGGGGAAPVTAAPAGAPIAPPMGDSTAAAASSSAPAAPAAAAPAAAEPAGMKLRDDPRYSKYFKMLNMGVPRPAIKQKMLSDGCPDPDQIDKDPDGPAPPGWDAVPSQALVVMETGSGSESEASGNMSDEEGN